MMITLIKVNKKTTDVITLQREGSLIIEKKGKLGKAMGFSSTSKFEDEEATIKELERRIGTYKKDGYIEQVEQTTIKDFEVFDKAKWHLENNFPDDLDSYQAYIHTGFYLGWLIKRNLISDEFNEQNKLQIKEFLEKKISPVVLYRDELDGVFTSNDVNEIGFNFTKAYFDFDNERFLMDYEETLAGDLPSLFHIEDTWENFEKIYLKIDQAFENWKEKN